MKKRRIIISDDEDDEEEERKEERNEERNENEEIKKRKRNNKELSCRQTTTRTINISQNKNKITLNSPSNSISNFISFLQVCHRSSSSRIEIENKRQNLFEEAKNSFNSINFTIISSKQLIKLFHLIDKHMFENHLNSLLTYEKHKVTFRVSQRMTSRAGQLLTDLRKPNEHELAISSYLLFKTFSNQHNILLESEVGERQIKVNGIECHNRLDCLLRIVEHEIIHLILCLPNVIDSIQKVILKQKNHRNIECECDCDYDCNCNNIKSRNNRLGRMPDETYHGKTFQLLAKVLFGHTEWTHDLITQDEIAYNLYNITVGAKVKFEFDGQSYSGKVNRVQKRVTILVKEKNKMNPHPDSREFSDGNFYRKFYVPIEQCQVIE